LTSPRKRHALELFAGLPARYERMGAALSFGQDPRWRRALVAAIAPQEGQRILDVATGTGLVARALARAAPCQVVAIDQSAEMLAGAHARLQDSPQLTGRITLMHGEAEHLPFSDGEFDALTFTYLLRYVDDREATLRELARVVRAGARIGMVEFGVPPNPALKALWRAHTRTVLPLIGRAVSSPWHEVGAFLGPSIEQFHAAEPDLPGLWRRAGIVDVRLRRMSFGAGLVMWGTSGQGTSGQGTSGQGTRGISGTPGQGTSGPRMRGQGLETRHGDRPA
jgi:demethylmenaquinone methyltransferase/2-methoxy-6-polyprenyl-1,4-benzoquinol methylase